MLGPGQNYFAENPNSTAIFKNKVNKNQEKEVSKLLGRHKFQSNCSLLLITDAIIY